MNDIPARRSWVPRADWLDRREAAPAGVGGRVVWVLTLVGALLRILFVTRPSVWVDEMLTWRAVHPAAGYGFVEQFLDTIQGPLYLAAVWPLTHARDTELMLRLPALLAGIVAVPLFGLLAGRVLAPRGARLALLLFALNPFLVWYSQEGRGYSFLLLFAVLTGWAYLELVRRGPVPGAVVGFGLAGAAMVLSNLSGVFLLAAMGLSLLTLHRPATGRAWGGWIFAFALAVLLSAPWLLKAAGIWAIDRVVPGAETGAALRGETTFSPLAVPYAFFTFLFGYSLGPSLRELHQPDRLAVLMGYAPVLGAAGVAAAVAVGAGLGDRERRRTVLLALWIAVPVAVLILLAVRNVKPWNPRYVAVVVPWLLLLAGAGLARLPRRIELGVAGLLVGLTVWSLGGYYGADKYAKADVRAAVAHVAAARPASGTVLVPVVTTVYAYYDRGGHELLDSFGWPPLASPAEADRFVAAVLAGHDFCRVVLARAWHFDPQGLLPAALSRAGLLRTEATFPGVVVMTWERRSNRIGDHES
ncbi:glycosyltransferase family 39 protein [bacterium]|nr:glycosyltransferase family 39 protein [bacterium]